MGILERRKKERAERKALILSCAKELILEQGAEKVSMMDIAQKTELSKATIYLYFPSKEILYKEISEESGLQFIDYFQSRLLSGISALDTIKLFWQCYLEVFGESDHRIVLFSLHQYMAPEFSFIPFGEHTADASRSSYGLFMIIKGIIEQGIREGSFEPDIDPAMVSRTILSLFSFIIESSIKTPRDKRNSRVIIGEIKNLFQIMLRGIAREGLNRSDITLPDFPEETRLSPEKNDTRVEHGKVV
jgi:AcrR family transcriptional regulator